MPPEAQSGKGAPSIYSNMAKMSMAKGGGGAPGGPAGGDAAGGMEEKKQIVTTLTSVLKKWEELEKDPKGKEIIQQMADQVKRYQSEVLKEAGQAGDKPADAPPGPPPPEAGTSGAGDGGPGAGGPGGKPMAA